MIGCLPKQALAFLAVFVYATHATQAIAFEWKPGFTDAAKRFNPIGVSGEGVSSFLTAHQHIKGYRAIEVIMEVKTNINNR